MRLPHLMAASVLHASSGCVPNSDPAGLESDDTAEPSTGGDDEGHQDTDDGCTDPTACDPIPARGIWIRSMEANQGVGVQIYADGAWLREDHRGGQFARVCDARGQWVESLGAPLVHGRRMLIRAWWELADGFESRDIEARLTLFEPGGGETIFRQIRPIEGMPRCAPEPEEIFHFVLPKEVVVTGVEAQLELFEVAHYEGEEHGDAPRGHATRRRDLGVTAIDAGLRVVAVPIHHNLGPSCPPAPSIDEETRETLARKLFAMHPVQWVDLTVHDPIVYDDPLDETFRDLLVDLARMHDFIAPGSHVHGFVALCDSGPPGVQGFAITIPKSPSALEPWMRTSVGRWFEDDIDKTGDVMVHEVGHGLGRGHVACNDNESDLEVGYPYELATIGGWGWDVREDRMVPPTSKEYMSYCDPPWVSDWGWMRVLPYLEHTTRMHGEH